MIKQTLANNKKSSNNILLYSTRYNFKNSLNIVTVANVSKWTQIVYYQKLEGVAKPQGAGTEFLLPGLGFLVAAE
jgi:hypothetical protein